MARGNASGCNAALRPRGRARAAHTGRACGANVWPGATRTGHADACEGRHVAREAGEWRAHGLVGPG